MKAANAEEVEAIRIKYLSKKGAITELFNEFREVPKEEKKELEERVEDADVFKYSYKPADPVNNDSAKIGNVDIPKWFAYLCSGIIIAILIALCYISNQSKKKMYYGRRD